MGCWTSSSYVLSRATLSHLRPDAGSAGAPGPPAGVGRQSTGHGAAPRPVGRARHGSTSSTAWWTACPDNVRAALVERAEGIPLFAVETVRGLIDRDLVIPLDGRYVLADGSSSTCGRSALRPLCRRLVAARLDALSPDERRIVADASVLGVTFDAADLSALVGNAALVDQVTAELVRKQILALETDRFSSARGQLRFVQTVVRQVAYDTLSRRDRKARHLAVARAARTAGGSSRGRRRRDRPALPRRRRHVRSRTTQTATQLERAASACSPLPPSAPAVWDRRSRPCATWTLPSRPPCQTSEQPCTSRQRRRHRTADATTSPSSTRSGPPRSTRGRATRSARGERRRSTVAR